jgi:hypothetical protein
VTRPLNSRPLVVPIPNAFETAPEDPDGTAADTVVNLRIKDIDDTWKHLAYSPDSVASLQFNITHQDSGDIFTMVLRVQPGRHFVWEE